MDKLLYCITLTYLKSMVFNSLNKNRHDLAILYARYNQDMKNIKLANDFHTIYFCKVKYRGGKRYEIN